MLSAETSPQDGDQPCHGPRQPSSPLLNCSGCATTTNTTHERAFSSSVDDDDTIALQEQVDPLNRSESLPKFSIRDYVSSVRSNNIKSNWPFSEVSLQLCLKHGVKDLLPPFQPPSSAKKNQPLKQIAVRETSLLEQYTDNVNRLEVKKAPERSSSRAVSSTTKAYAPLCNAATLTDHVAVSHIDKDLLCNSPTLEVRTPDNIDTRRSSSGEKHIASTITTAKVSQSELVESSLPRISPVAETPTLLEASAPAAEVPSPQAQKGKKCKLIVKLGSSSFNHNTAAEDTTSNSTVALTEAMASKVCPVCKTFSSSSNTTLNAHIDQCLSVESTSKWVPESSVERHRIKPRKMRLMADICATAFPCTLEELDRRNGTSWASGDHLALPARNPEAQVCNKEKKQNTLPVPSTKNDGGDSGSVYIDSSGTKLRILSKLNDAPSVLRMLERPRLKKGLIRNKGIEKKSNNKKKHHLEKRHKYLRLASQMKQSGSLNSSNAKFHMALERNFEGNDSQEKNDMTHIGAQEQTRPKVVGPPRHVGCIKRTGLFKQSKGKDINQVSECKSDAAQDWLVARNQSCHNGYYAVRSCFQRSSSASEDDPILNPKSSQRGENPIHDAVVEDYRERSSRRKRAGSPLCAATTSDHVMMPFSSSKKKVKPSSKDSASLHGCSDLKLQKSDKSLKTRNAPFRNPDISQYKKAPALKCHESHLEALRSSGLTTEPLSVSQLPRPESISKVNRRRYIISEENEVEFTREVDEGIVAGPSEVNKQHNWIRNNSIHESSIEGIEKVYVAGRQNPDKKRRGRPASFSNWEKACMAKTSLTEAQCHKVVKSVESDDTLAGTSDSHEVVGKAVQYHAGNDYDDPSAILASDKSMTSLSESLRSEYHRLAVPFDSDSDPLRSSETFKLPLCRGGTSRGFAESNFSHGDESFFADEVANDISEQVISFSEVDPIPIPGPPGSFLPSPRGMSSDDLPGSSSLTTSRGLSSQDKKELVDGDSSDSPVSATSSISTPAAAASYLSNLEKTSSLGPDRVTSTENASEQDVTGHAACLRVKGPSLEGDTMEVNEMGPENGHTTYRDNHVCCCSRKERIPQTVTLNYQDSKLLRRRTMLTGKQMDSPPNARAETPNGCGEVFHSNDCSSSGLGKGLVMVSPAGPTPMKVVPNASLRVPSQGDIDPASTSASSPILRLMGKNLMVVNKDEDVSTRFSQPQRVDSNNWPNAQVGICSSISYTNQNLEYRSFYQPGTQGLHIFNHDQPSLRMECIENRMTKDFNGCMDFKMPQSPPREPAGVFLGNSMGGSYAAYLGAQQQQGGGYMRPQPIRLDTLATRDIGKSIGAPDLQLRRTNCFTNSGGEIIVIDDGPDDSRVHHSNHTTLRGSPLMTLAGCTTPVNVGYMSSFSNNKLLDPPLGQKNASFHMPPARRAFIYPF